MTQKSSESPYTQDSIFGLPCKAHPERFPYDSQCLVGSQGDQGQQEEGLFRLLLMQPRTRFSFRAHFESLELHPRSVGLIET